MSEAEKNTEALLKGLSLMAQDNQEQKNSEKSEKEKSEKKENPEKKKRRKERLRKLRARAKIIAGKVMKALGKAMKMAAKAMKMAAKAMQRAAKAMVRTANAMIKAAAATGPAAIVAVPAAIAVAVPMYAAAGAMMATSAVLQAGAVAMDKAGAALEKGGAKLENSGRQEMQQSNAAEGNSATMTQSNDNTLSDVMGKNDKDKDDKDNGKDDDNKTNILDIINTAATMYMVYDTVKNGQSKEDLKATMAADRNRGAVQPGEPQHAPVAQQMKADKQQAMMQEERIYQALQNGQVTVQQPVPQRAPITPQNGQIFSMAHNMSGRS